MRLELLTLQRGVHVRARAKWRGQMKLLKGKRDDQRKIQQELKKYIKYALKRPAQAGKVEVLTEIIDGKINVMDNEKEIHECEKEYIQEFMGRNRKRWYLKKRKLHPNLRNTRKGKVWRRKNTKRYNDPKRLGMDT